MLKCYKLFKADVGLKVFSQSFQENLSHLYFSVSGLNLSNTVTIGPKPSNIIWLCYIACRLPTRNKSHEINKYKLFLSMRPIVCQNPRFLCVSDSQFYKCTWWNSKLPISFEWHVVIINWDSLIGAHDYWLKWFKTMWTEKLCPEICINLYCQISHAFQIHVLCMLDHWVDLDVDTRVVFIM